MCLGGPGSALTTHFPQDADEDWFARPDLASTAIFLADLTEAVIAASILGSSA
jgi:hypothetical protein